MEKLFDVEPYAGFLATRKNENTKRGYEADLRKLKGFLDCRKIQAVQATKKDLRDFSSQLLTQGYKNSFILHVMASVSAFYQDLAAIDLITVVPSIVFKRVQIKREKNLPRALVPEERERLVRSLKNTPYIQDRRLEDFRISIITLLGLHCGLRVSEISGLKWEDVDLKKKCIVVRDAKGDKNRVQPMSSTLAHDLKTFRFEWEQKYGWFSGSYLIRAPKKDKPLHVSQVQRLVKKGALNAKLGRSVNVHDLRHTFADWLRKAGVDTYTISGLLGHDHISTTTRYYLHQDENLKSKAIQSAFG